ncbi:unnamed protein product, partial [Rangifer tarandus platyrhynchus]
RHGYRDQSPNARKRYRSQTQKHTTEHPCLHQEVGTGSPGNVAAQVCGHMSAQLSGSSTHQILLYLLQLMGQVLAYLQKSPSFSCKTCALLTLGVQLSLESNYSVHKDGVL